MCFKNWVVLESGQSLQQYSEAHCINTAGRVMKVTICFHG